MDSEAGIAYSAGQLGRNDQLERYVVTHRNRSSFNRLHAVSCCIAMDSCRLILSMIYHKVRMHVSQRSQAYATRNKPDVQSAYHQSRG